MSPLDRSIKWRPDIPRWEVGLFYGAIGIGIVGCILIAFSTRLGVVGAFLGLGAAFAVRMRGLRIRIARTDGP
jgi:hypothetical protein